MTYMNETLRLIQDRRSIRKFTDTPLTRDQIDLLTSAAMASPSAMNRQPWRFHFIVNPVTIAAINDAALTKFNEDGNQAVLERLASRGADSIFYGAPLVVIITAARSEMTGYAMIDVGIATENIVLAAQSIGLGSCVIGLASAAFSGYHRMTVGQAIQMPDDHEFAISIAIGYPAMTKDAHENLPGHLVVIE